MSNVTISDLIAWHKHQANNAFGLEQKHRISAQTFKRNPEKSREFLGKADTFKTIGNFHVDAAKTLQQGETTNEHS